MDVLLLWQNHKTLNILWMSSSQAPQIENKLHWINFFGFQGHAIRSCHSSSQKFDNIWHMTWNKFAWKLSNLDSKLRIEFNYQS
jgi:hypothetical protein